MPNSDSLSGPNPKRILFNKYQLGRLLGCGSSAKVYHARNLQTGLSVAIKVFPKSRISKHHQTREHLITREIAIMRRLRHPHIVRLLEVLASHSKIYFVLELVPHGELFDHIARSGKLSEEASRTFFHQLIAAVGYCHSRGVFHRDLKPENLLLDDNGDLKVTDFGLSALPDQIRPDGRLHTLCGTPAYVAPEVLSKEGYDGAKIDVWSCGVILFVLSVGYLPFNDTNLMTLYRKIYRGEFRVPKWISPDLKRLICRMLETNPGKRVSVDEIVNDPWFKNGLDQEKWTALIKFQDEEQKEEEEEEEERELNAFDIISFSLGVNLSGLFDEVSSLGSGLERFVSAETSEAILGKVVEVGRKEGCLLVKRKGQNGKSRSVVVRGQDGNFVVKVGVKRLVEGMVVVEVDKGKEKWAQEFWGEKLKCVLKGVGGGDSGYDRRMGVVGVSCDWSEPVL